MKKLLLVMMAALCVATVSAKGGVKDFVNNSKWSAGLRVGSGLQADAECFYGKKTYIEARFGMAWLGGVTADFTALHNWNCCNWNWTPEVGSWFLDAGVGANIGGAKCFAYGGVAGMVKFGIKFKKAPVRLSIDYTPVIGIAGTYMSKEERQMFKLAGALEDGMGGFDTGIGSASKMGADVDAAKREYKKAFHKPYFHTMGFANVGISATYCF